MPSIRTALIGCGKVGSIHARVLSTLDESNFSAVCDTDQSRAESFGVEFKTAAYSSVRKMIQRENIQAVCICTPHPLHAAAAIEAAECGAHILVEKPLAANLRDCDLMIEASKRHGVHLGVVSQRRFFEPVQRMKAAIDAGKIGRPVLGTIQMLSWRDLAYYQSDPWRGKWATEGGGVLVNQAPHLLDILYWLMGSVEEITGYWANLNHPGVEVEDTAVASVRFQNGGLGSIVTSLSQRPGIYSKLHIHGSNGASVGVQTDTGASFIAGINEIEEPPVNDLWTIPGEESRLPEFIAQDSKQFRERRDPDYYHRLQIHDFLNAILTKTRPLVTASHGRAVVELFTGIYLSNRNRCSIRFPLVPDSGN
ncbi:MAG: Gfo/Idh/MocA family oxidoreductase [Bryobacteraceae bacterium]